MKPKVDVTCCSFVAALFATAATVPIIAACTARDTAHPPEPAHDHPVRRFGRLTRDVDVEITSGELGEYDTI